MKLRYAIYKNPKATLEMVQKIWLKGNLTYPQLHRYLENTKRVLEHQNDNGEWEAVPTVHIQRDTTVLEE